MSLALLTLHLNVGLIDLLAGNINTDSPLVVLFAHIERANTEFGTDLPAGEYDIRVSDFYNIIYLKANDTYNDAGGQKGAVNLIDLAGITISAR